MKNPHNHRPAASAWVEKAEHDLRTAEHTFTLEEDCPFDTICFHAQQCAEKYLKALLVWKEIDFPKTHDLRLLIQIVPADTGIAVSIKEVIALNRYTIEARYPGFWEPIDRKEAQKAVELAKQVRNAVRAVLSPEVLQ